MENDDIHSAAINSLIVAFAAAPAATIIATLAALVMVRGGDFKSRALTSGLISLPLMVPEIVTAVATLIFFALLKINFGLINIILAHTVFCIPFAFMPIRAALEAMDAGLEVAAQDLYADRWQAFRHVTRARAAWCTSRRSVAFSGRHPSTWQPKLDVSCRALPPFRCRLPPL